MTCSLAARHLHLLAWLYANREHTDGILRTPDFRTAAAEAQLSELEATSAAAELIVAGLWSGRLPEPGYSLVEFLKWNHDANAIKQRVAENLARVHAFRNKKVSPDPFQEDRSYRSTEAQVRNQLRNALQGEPMGKGEIPPPTPEELRQAEVNRHLLASLAASKAI